MIKKRTGLTFAIVVLFFGLSIAPNINAYITKNPIYEDYIKLDNDINELCSRHISNDSFTGNIIYVDDDNTGGPWYGTEEYPFNKIEDGIKAANNNDTVYVFNGIYREGYLKIEKSIKLIGENKENTIIDNEYIHDEIIILKDNGIKISGFTIKNADSTLGRCSGITLYHANYNIITDNIIKNIKSRGIWGVCSSYNIIFNNIIINNDFGIYLHGSTSVGQSSYNKIIKNHIEENNYGSIKLIGYFIGEQCLGRNLIVRNNFVNNGNQDKYFENSYQNFWFNNYWSEKHNLPVIIKGVRTIWINYLTYYEKRINVYKFDLYPAKFPIL